MEKEFVPYEQSLELKKLGFDEPCFGWFRSTLIPSNFTEYFLDTEFGMNESPSDWVNSNFSDKTCSAPLYQQSFRWFREKYGLYFNIHRLQHKIGTKEEFMLTIDAPLRGGYYKTLEEAELECLKKLIEIVKEK